MVVKLAAAWCVVVVQELLLEQTNGLIGIRRTDRWHWRFPSNVETPQSVQQHQLIGFVVLYDRLLRDACGGQAR